MQLNFDEIDGWSDLRAKEKKLLWTYLLFGLVAIAALVAGAKAANEGRYVATVCYLAAAAAAATLLITTTVVLVLRRRLTPRITSRAAVPFTVHTATSHVIGTVSFLALTAAALISATIGYATHSIDLDTSTLIGKLLAWTAPALAALSVIWLLTYALGYQRFPRVTATSRSLTVRGPWAQETATWDDITAINAATSQNNAAVSMRLASGSSGGHHDFAPALFRRRSSGPLTVPVDIFPTGAVPLLLLLRYYLEHPEARDELDDGRTYERLRTIAA